MPTTFIDGQTLTGPALTAALAVATADSASVAPVASVAGRIGNVVLAVADVSGAYASTNPAGYLIGASPVLTGTPTAPTASLGTSTTQLATTGFVAAAVVASTTGVATFNTRSGAVALTSGDVTTALTFTPANIASPTFTGTPAAPTVAATSAAGTTQIATTAFVRNGTTTNDAAVAGQVGQYVSATLAIGSAISLTTNVAANVISISLTAGDWDVAGTAALTASVGAVSGAVAISTTSATLPTAPNAGGYSQFANTAYTTTAWSSTAGPMRISLATTTTVYLVVVGGFVSGTYTAFGFLGARRVR